MKTEFAPRRLDVAAFAEAAGTLTGSTPLRELTRLAQEATELPSDATVPWQARGEQRVGATGAPTAWLHLAADAVLPLVCQRCLAPVDTDLSVDRWFRFAADEDTAAREDEDAEEDVLALSRELDLLELLEDELLMEIPVTPRHAVCPETPRLSVADDDFESAEDSRPNPFAVLGSLRTRKPE